MQVGFHEDTWVDRKWDKAVDKLPAQDRQRIDDSLAALIEELRDANHPTLANELQRWQPKAYHPPRPVRGTSFYEYRLKHRRNTARAVAAYRPGGAGEPGEVAMVARTVTHDNKRLDAMILKYRAAAG